MVNTAIIHYDTVNRGLKDATSLLLLSKIKGATVKNFIYYSSKIGTEFKFVGADLAIKTIESNV